VFWAGNLEEAGQVLHGYQSAWVPASLLQKDQQKNLADALFAAAQHWRVSLHVFFVHHGVGSERWSANGFTRLT